VGAEWEEELAASVPGGRRSAKCGAVVTNAVLVACREHRRREAAARRPAPPDKLRGSGRPVC